ncbi:hypothetical protein NNJEOMEG_01331 [Fundidesulfovibrio magnetotacticus]|uniref:Uncharacterized protein n=1 Tax=Fundidesulfovibrio magnetotacticus TaxID=2730080 RepID=A0A6V8LT52_9BACT|nr:hypothetical protein [Fundidesulfovibrio magnetotacticus]GFK93498.1 hypothetical protein NNJEOMEG_01331 [Fundidesulfovibrio magnetotacticus]
MKRLATLCLIACALLSLAAPAQAQGKFVTEFKGMVFGKPFTDFQRMKPIRQQGDMALYSRYGDDHQFQGVATKDEAYGFFKGVFCVVMFTAQGPTAYNTLKSYFDANFGPASQPKVNMKQFTYTAGEVSIELTYDDTRKIAEVSYMYRPVMRSMTGGKP